MQSNCSSSSSSNSRNRGGAAARLTLWAALAATALAGGCQPQWTWSWETNSWQRVGAPAPAKPANPDLDDPCAERLHDIEGQLVFYYHLHGQLPARLDELKNLTSENVPLTCPVTGQPYLYAPDGLEILNSNRRVIVYDAQPCRAGVRHVIVADPIRPGKPLIIQVPPPMRDDETFAPPPASVPAGNG
jgi:hypothetical protein